MLKRGPGQPLLMSRSRATLGLVDNRNDPPTFPAWRNWLAIAMAVACLLVVAGSASEGHWLRLGLWVFIGVSHAGLYIAARRSFYRSQSKAVGRAARSPEVQGP